VPVVQIAAAARRRLEAPRRVENDLRHAPFLDEIFLPRVRIHADHLVIGGRLNPLRGPLECRPKIDTNSGWEHERFDLSNAARPAHDRPEVAASLP
jgi:hypothetical protein